MTAAWLGAIGKGLDSKRTKAEAIRAIHEAATEEWIIMERWEEKALGRPLTEESRSTSPQWWNASSARH